MTEWIYIDRNNVEIPCSNGAEFNRKWRDRYLEDGGLSHEELIKLKGQTVTLQLEEGKYLDQNVSDTNYVVINELFIPLKVNQIIIEMDYKIDVEFKLEEFEVPIKRYRSNTITPREVIYPYYIGFNGLPEDIWDDNERAKTYKPLVILQASSDKEIDEVESDRYNINASIILPNGKIIGN